MLVVVAHYCGCFGRDVVDFGTGHHWPSKVVGSGQGRFAPPFFKNMLVVVAHYCGCFGLDVVVYFGTSLMESSALGRGASRPRFSKIALLW